MANAGGDERAERGEQLDVVIEELVLRALDDERAERPRLAADRNGEEHGVLLLA